MSKKVIGKIGSISFTYYFLLFIFYSKLDV